MYVSLPNLPLLRRRHCLGLRDQVIVRHNPSAGFQSGDRSPQDLDDVRIRPVVEDVTEQIHVRLDRLRLEEIVLHKLKPAGHVGRYGFFGSEYHVGEILHDEVQVPVRLGERDADVAPGAAHIHHGAFTFVADARPGIALRQEAGREAVSVGEGRHGPGEASGHLGVRGVELPDGLVGVLRQAPTGFVGFVASEALPRFDRVRKRLPDLVEHVSQPGLGVGVFRELARGGGMGQVSFARFLEDAVVGYGEADDASEVGFRHAAFLSEVREGDLAVEGDVGCDVVFVDCLQAHTVQLQQMTPSAGGLQLGECWISYHGPKAHGRPEEKLVEFEAGIEGCFAGFLDFFIFDSEIDGALFMEGWRG